MQKKVKITVVPLWGCVVSFFQADGMTSDAKQNGEWNDSNSKRNRNKAKRFNYGGPWRESSYRMEACRWSTDYDLRLCLLIYHTLAVNGLKAYL
jgi:hypothetical protein